MKRRKIKKGAIGLILALLMASISLVASNAFTINGGSLTCDAIKSTLRSDSSETGSSIIVLSEDCTANLYIRADQSIILDTAGHTLSSSSGATITVERGGSLTLNNYSEIGTVSGSTVISNSGTVEIKKGNIIGNIVEVSGSNAETIITGGTFSIDPSSFVPEGYTVERDGSNYKVTANGVSDEDSIDISKITASNDDLRMALIITLYSYIDNPETSSQNGQMLAQLINSIKQGHTISASLVTNENLELEEDVMQMILGETAGTNLNSVYEINFVVRDTVDSSLTVSLKNLAVPVTVSIPISDYYKAAFANRDLAIVNFHKEDDGTYLSDFIDDVVINANGDVAFETSQFSLFALTYDGDPITSDGDAPDYIRPPSTDDGDGSGDSGGDDGSGSNGGNGNNGGSNGDNGSGSSTDYDNPAVPQTDGSNSYNGSASQYNGTGSSSIDEDTAVPNTAGFGTDLATFHSLMAVSIVAIIGAFVGYAARRAYVKNRISLK